MSTANPDIATDLCYRCGYDLRATPDDRPCPECGLLAARSRRPSDELRHSRPRWLMMLAIGASLVIAAIVAVLAAFAVQIGGEWDFSYFGEELQDATFLMSVLVAMAVVFLVGIYLLTRREGYPPADLADRRRRRLLRAVAVGPLAAAILGLLYTVIGAQRGVGVINGATTVYTFHTPTPALGWASLIVAAVGLCPLALLTFVHLRGLAKRARSAQLAEHCGIVGIGAAGSLVYLGGYVILLVEASNRQWAGDWSLNSPWLYYLTLTLLVLASLFLLWSFYLLLRFTLSFISAARAIRMEQRASDLAVLPTPNTTP